MTLLHTQYIGKTHCFVSEDILVLGFDNTIIPDNITQIGGGAFNCCKFLKKVNIPKGVTNIGDLAFWGCVGLCNVVIPRSVQKIGNLVFWDCKNLQSIFIPDSVLEMGNSVFAGCVKLAIYCQHKEKPKDWHDEWNPLNCQVSWGVDNI
ncbi:MAG: leucine-rich repeat domain-containing protein [Clostridiales bacterium]|jgi:hypothetical protein|nr:leucine-rich repeat domain-containing protein [Clostridiales bacterium]